MPTGFQNSSDKQNWMTPLYVFEPLQEEFKFGWDCAATRSANILVRASCTDKDRFFGPDHPNPKLRDALALPWAKLLLPNGIDAVWCNPPYGRSIRQWTKKFRHEAAQGLTIVSLLYARTETKWFWGEMWDAAEIRLADRRIVFVDPTTGDVARGPDGRPAGATAGHALYIHRPGHTGPPTITRWEVPKCPRNYREEVIHGR